MIDRASSTIADMAKNNSFTTALHSKFKEEVVKNLVEFAVSSTVKGIVGNLTISFKLSESNRDNPQMYQAFMRWLVAYTSNTSSNCQVLLGSAETDTEQYDEYGDLISGHHNSTLDIGDRPIFFKYKGYFFSAKKAFSQTSRNNEITVMMLGRKKSVMRSLISEFRPVVDKTTRVCVYKSSMGGDWKFMGNSSKRSLDTVITSTGVKEKILDRIARWKSNEQWYHDRGISHKLAMILYGPPGTGKTSLVKALASQLGYSVYLLDLRHFSDSSLHSAIHETDNKCIILLEDVDSHLATHARDQSLTTSDDRTEDKGNPLYNDEDDDDHTPQHGAANKTKLAGGVTLSGLLNTLDGIVPIDNKIIIMTTNTIGKLDSALTRKGRVDAKYYVGEFTDKEVREYIRLMFGADVKISDNMVFNNISGCDLQDLFFVNMDSAEQFIDSIPCQYKSEDFGVSLTEVKPHSTESE